LSQLLFRFILASSKPAQESLLRRQANTQLLLLSNLLSVDSNQADEGNNENGDSYNLQVTV
jgi:hypothetical protein